MSLPVSIKNTLSRNHLHKNLQLRLCLQGTPTTTVGKRESSNQGRGTIKCMGCRHGCGHLMNTGGLYNVKARSLDLDYVGNAKPVDDFRGGKENQFLS